MHRIRFTTADVTREYPDEVRTILRCIVEVTKLASFANAWVSDDSLLSDFGLSTEQVTVLGEKLGFEVRGWETISKIAERLTGWEPPRRRRNTRAD